MNSTHLSFAGYVCVLSVIVRACVRVCVRQRKIYAYIICAAYNAKTLTRAFDPSSLASHSSIYHTYAFTHTTAPYTSLSLSHVPCILRVKPRQFRLFSTLSHFIRSRIHSHILFISHATQFFYSFFFFPLLFISFFFASHSYKILLNIIIL